MFEICQVLKELFLPSLKRILQKLQSADMIKIYSIFEKIQKNLDKDKRKKT